AHVPYDALYIMVNHSRYGGGGIYNLYCTFTTGNQYKDFLFIHEFGHSFTGLADEYYTSSTAYNDFYPRGVEPVEPNITALINPQNLKWEKLLTPGIGIPTPWEKADYDSMDLRWQSGRREMNNKIAELKRNKSHFLEIEKAEKEYAQKDKEHSELVDSYLKGSRYHGQVGVFEGAGYSSKGLYRPMLDCIMFSKGDKPFCTVCNGAIVKVINHYSE
ncbi:MAG: M64 family metallopeptidase, partial [Ignavibacteriaceae bacterium]